MPLGNLPPKAQRQWDHVYYGALERGLSPSRAAASAWSVVKRGYRKVGGRWVPKRGRR